MTILEGESLLNDATALVALRTAIAATSCRRRGRARRPWTSCVASVGGAAVGFAGVRGRRQAAPAHHRPGPRHGISFVVPFGAYIAAEKIQASGVIAVVVAGLLLGHKAPIVQTAQSRIAERMNWRTIAFVLENTVFLLIGLQAGWIFEDVSDSTLSTGRIVAVCAAVLVGCIVLRLVWVFPPATCWCGRAPTPTTGQRPPWTYTLHPRLGRHARRGHARRGVRDPRGHRRTARCCC